MNVGIRELIQLLMLGSMLLMAASGAELALRKTITLEIAKKMAAAAEEHALKNKWNVVIAILDEGGHLIYLARMEGTQIGSVEVAQTKARSAIYFKRPTKVFSDAVAGGRTAVISLPGALAIEGGLPIEWEGQILGSIGVSGVTSEQDGMIAQAGLNSLKKILGQ
jgi:uncharacterized protein GlcG (DUF336 family)